MRRLLIVIVALVLASFSGPSLFANSLFCSVGLSEVSPSSTSTTDIHSAGLVRAYNSTQQIVWSAELASDHYIVQQSNNSTKDVDFGSGTGELHTYARATVSIGQMYIATIDAADHTRFLNEECSKNLILEDPEPPEDPSIEDPAIQGGGSGGTGGGEGPTEGSPIVIDADRGGFRFTDLSGGVRFDLDGDGAAEAISWLAPGSNDAWLALDRDGDGSIGSGAELFGNFTPQPPTDAPHGYLALAVFDTPAEGGDGDGAITAADAVFDALRLWIDADHDGVSQPGELHPLAAAGVRALDLGFVESRRRDPHGNQLRYTSRVDLHRGTTQATDVFLLVGR